MDDVKRALPRLTPSWGLLTRRNILSGLLFIAIAAAGLWISWGYPVGTALRMGTGYVPRLLLWLLLFLGAVIFVRGLGESDEKPASDRTSILRPLFFVSAALVVFGLTIESLGLVVAIVLMLGLGSFATRDLGWIETAVTTVALLAIALTIFVLGLGLTIPVWPDL